MYFKRLQGLVVRVNKRSICDYLWALALSCKYPPTKPERTYLKSPSKLQAITK